ncbi:MAG: DNA repair protein RecN [Flavobacteriaceae bacterium]|nr:DNA repair protein RecN [Flavobacteriaceae bacterium]
MLQSISIVNFALIDDIQSDFGRQLNVVTGETGSGKSIVMDALSLVLGARADLSAVRDASKKCIVEAIFDLSKSAFKSVFDDLQVDFEVETILRREILPSGKSRSFINDTPVQLEKLRFLGSQLVDLHSQHQTSQLADPRFHFDLLDAFSDALELRAEYQQTLEAFKQEEKHYHEMLEVQRGAKESYDYNCFLFAELKELELHDDIQTQLEEERNLLQHADDIKQTIQHVLQISSMENNGLTDQLSQCRMDLQKLESYSDQYKALSERVQNLWYEWTDIQSNLSSMDEELVVDPMRLEAVNQTLSKIYSLQHKHHVHDIRGLMDKEQELETLCQVVLEGDEEIQSQKHRLDKAEKTAWKLATELAKKRRDHAQKLANKLSARLVKLGMEHARFDFQLDAESSLGSVGADSLTLLFSANKGVGFSTLRKVASGGERSRIMLVIKSILAKNDHCPTMILDEIDAGVSGEMAKAMGSFMKDISEHTQLIAITHLPQIAAMGNSHIKVYKSSDDQTTRTYVKQLEGEDRVIEIAQMIDGNQITQTARTYAEKLLN